MIEGFERRANCIGTKPLLAGEKQFCPKLKKLVRDPARAVSMSANRVSRCPVLMANYTAPRTEWILQEPDAAQLSALTQSALGQALPPLALRLLAMRGFG